jgi:protein tyrosine phosphatase (PTP) superfamily phosphohydrolase (DUF442 family)
MTLRPLALALLLVAPSAAAAGPDTTPARSPLPTIPSIVRFAQVDGRLFRGGQPDLTDYARLREMGIDTVISFREEDDERATVEALGMKWVHLPVTMKPFGGSNQVSRSTIDQFFKVVDDPASGNVFVHCLHGKDRTGLFVSLYRITRQGWDVDDAYHEARDIGMSWWHYKSRSTMERIADVNDDDNDSQR